MGWTQMRGRDGACKSLVLRPKGWAPRMAGQTGEGGRRLRTKPTMPNDAGLGNRQDSTPRRVILHGSPRNGKNRPGDLASRTRPVQPSFPLWPRYFPHGVRPDKAGNGRWGVPSLKIQVSRCAQRQGPAFTFIGANHKMHHEWRGNEHPVALQQTSILQITMGDKSPKANQKKSSQKQSKASSAEASKKAAVAAKSAAAKKK